MTKIKWPKCEWCGSDQCHICKVCDKFTCWECVKYPKPDTCTHQRYETPTVIDWNEYATNEKDQTNF